jgi:two-component system sensor histidine kinase ChiS
MSDKMSRHQDWLSQELGSAQTLLDEIRQTADSELADKLEDLASTLEALAAERDLLAELQAAQAGQVPLGEMMLALRNELLTPLIAIEGYADLVLNQLREPLSTYQTQFLRLIIQNQEVAVKLVHNFTDVVRLMEDELGIMLEPITVADAMEGFQARTRALVRARKHTLIVDIPKDLPEVRADLWRLDQVMTELVGNACRYTPDGGIITVMVKAVPNGVKISISDTGVGMTREQVSRLGDLFYRSPHPQVQGQPGAGLGFYIARELVRLMQSEIKVESKPEDGSTFSFTLPAVT